MGLTERKRKAGGVATGTIAAREFLEESDSIAASAVSPALDYAFVRAINAAMDNDADPNVSEPDPAHVFTAPGNDVMILTTIAFSGALWVWEAKIERWVRVLAPQAFAALTEGASQPTRNRKAFLQVTAKPADAGQLLLGRIV